MVSWDWQTGRVHTPVWATTLPGRKALVTKIGWTGQPSAYDNQMYDSYGMQQDSGAYSVAPGDSYEVKEREAELSGAYHVEVEKVEKSWEERIAGQRKLDYKEYQKLIDMKDELISDLQGAFDTQVENRQKTFVDEFQAEVSRVDPRVEGLQAQIETYASAEQARTNLPEPKESNDRKLTEDVRVARQIADDLNAEKMALVESENKLNGSVDSLTTSNEELGKRLAEVVKQLASDKEVADDKISTLQKQVDETPKVHPDTEKELATLKSKVEALEKANKKIPTLTNQLKKSQEKVESLETATSKTTGELEVSQEKVKSLEPAANQVPAITKDLEESQAKVMILETAASEHVCPVPVRAVTQENGTQMSKETVLSRHQRYKAKKEADDLLAREKLYEDQKIELANAEASLKTTKSQMDSAVVKNTVLTESFRAKSCELSKVTKYRAILARILIILVMVLYAAAMCIPHIIPKRRQQVSSFETTDAILTNDTIPDVYIPACRVIDIILTCETTHTEEDLSFPSIDTIWDIETLSPDDPNYYTNIESIVQRMQNT
ncbi:hypothetical protein IFR05_002694 [Cadophora sp. M221]|nr:hypothetical protein IFR05_002694 [Cadophora sp. M221]